MRSCHCHNKQRIATGSSGKITWSHRLIHPSIQHWSSPSYRFDKRGLSDWCHSHTRSDNVCIYIVGWLYLSVAYYIWILQSVLPNHTCSLYYLLLVTTWPHETQLSHHHPPIHPYRLGGSATASFVCIEKIVIFVFSLTVLVDHMHLHKTRSKQQHRLVILYWTLITAVNNNMNKIVRKKDQITYNSSRWLTPLALSFLVFLSKCFCFDLHKKKKRDAVLLISHNSHWMCLFEPGHLLLLDDDDHCHVSPTWQCFSTVRPANTKKVTS